MHAIRIIFILSVVIIFNCPQIAFAQIKAYPIDAWHSKIGFEVEFGGLFDVSGRFNSIHGTLLLDETDLTKTSATVIIDAESIDTGVGLRDRHLKSDDFFDVENHPRIIFSSNGVEQKEGNFVMTGDLTMHGITRNIEIPFFLIHGEKPDSWKNFRVTLGGKTKLKRTDFGIGDDPAIANEVGIDLLVSARILNMETIALFTRPFGKEVFEKIKEEGVQEGISHYYHLKESGDEDTEKASGLMFLQMKLNQEGMVNEALEISKLAVKEFPEEAYFYSMLGYAYYEQGKKIESKKAFEKALSMDKQETLALEMMKILK